MKKCMCCMRDYEDKLTACPVCGYSLAQMREDRELFSDALPPETILGGRFILGRVLSITDFSVLYMAWDALLLKRVVIREYLPAQIGGRDMAGGDVLFSDAGMQGAFEEGRAVFEQEAQQLCRSQDIPGIVHELRVVRENKTSYIVMDYLEGCTLQDILDERGIPSDREADEFFMQLAAVLEMLHRREICHGNLAPENIYLDENGNLTLLDFGNAKAAALELFGPAVNVFNPAYTAPEMLRRGRGVRVQSDIYSAGAVYYTLLTGKQLRDGGRAGRIRTGREEKDKLIRMMTNPVSAKRPASFTEVRQMLQ